MRFRPGMRKGSLDSGRVLDAAVNNLTFAASAWRRLVTGFEGSLYTSDEAGIVEINNQVAGISFVRSLNAVTINETGDEDRNGFEFSSDDDFIFTDGDIILSDTGYIVIGLEAETDGALVCIYDEDEAFSLAINRSLGTTEVVAKNGLTEIRTTVSDNYLVVEWIHELGKLFLKVNGNGIPAVTTESDDFFIGASIGGVVDFEDESDTDATAALTTVHIGPNFNGIITDIACWSEAPDQSIREEIVEKFLEAFE